MHKCILPSFFFTQNTRAPRGDTLGRMMYFSNNSFNCAFNSLNYTEDILYVTMETIFVLGTNSMDNSTSLSGTSSWNTSRNSHTIRIEEVFFFWSKSMVRIKRKALSSSNRQLIILTVPSKSVKITLFRVVASAGMKMVFSLQPNYTKLVESQSIPSTTYIFLKDRNIKLIEKY